MATLSHRLEFGRVSLPLTRISIILILLFFTYLSIQAFNLDNSVLLSVFPAAVYANADTDKALIVLYKGKGKISGVYR